MTASSDHYFTWASPDRLVLRTDMPRIFALLMCVPAVTTAPMLFGGGGGVARWIMTPIAIALVILAVRLWFSRVELTADTLTIANPLRTRLVPRTEIADFTFVERFPRSFTEVGRALGPWQIVGLRYVVRRDGAKIPMAACWFLNRGNLPPAPRERALAAAMRDWTASGKPPISPGTWPGPPTA